MGKATILQYSRINYRSINEGAIVNQIKTYQPHKYRQLSNDFGKKTHLAWHQLHEKKIM